MNVYAFVLAIISIIIFVAAFYGVARRWASTNLGLAFLVAAWIAQLVIDTTHVIHS